MNTAEIFKTTSENWEELMALFDRSLSSVRSFSEEEWDKLHTCLQTHSYPKYDTFAYKKDGKIIAYISYYDSKIEMLYVLPEYMNQGIGQTLIRYVIDYYKETMIIGVNKNNHIAMHIYKKMGFVSYDEKDYDISGVYSPHYLMRREYTES